MSGWRIVRTSMPPADSRSGFSQLRCAEEEADSMWYLGSSGRQKILRSMLYTSVDPDRIGDASTMGRFGAKRSHGGGGSAASAGDAPGGMHLGSC